MTIELRGDVLQNAVECSTSAPGENSDDVPRVIQERVGRAGNRPSVKSWKRLGDLHPVPLYQLETKLKGILERTFLFLGNPPSASQPATLGGFEIPSD